MRYLVSPEFGQKLASFSSKTIADVREALGVLENSSKDELMSGGRLVPLNVGEGLFAYRAGTSRLFLSFEEDNNGEFALVVDLASRHSSFGGHTPSRSTDFQLEQNLDPKFNSQINPKLNSQINPKLNSQINPTLNSQINPKFNSQINPKFNSQINPKFNSQINPKFNSSLNPRFNWSIDVRRNPSLSVPKEFDLRGNFIGYIVKANETVWLVFDEDADWSKFAVDNLANGFVVFNLDGEWIEHWVSNGGKGWNRFALSNEWIGVTT